MRLSKTRIDRAGAALARGEYRSDDEYLEADDVFDLYRGNHLSPLSETTSEIQNWLTGYAESYYLAQRLKRKPQIIRKLRRLSVRLSQLQDVGGLRVIVPRNSDVDQLLRYLQDRIDSQADVSITRKTDYREKGRDRTGYRALHLILGRAGVSLELQLRSRVQHYWAENIERTSVIYGYHLKEEEGDAVVIKYFKSLSEAFYEIEAGRDPSAALRLSIDSQRSAAERIILDSPRASVLDGRVNEGVIKAIAGQAAGSSNGINNWILVFDWNTGSFVHWTSASRDPSAAMELYIENERNFKAEDGFEVVLVGASEAATLRQTHSHYFGLESYETALESLNVSIEGFSRRMDLGIGSRQILLALHRKHKWGASRVSRDTIKKHYCPTVVTLEESLEALIARGYITEKSGISLNQKKKAEIESQL